MKMKARRGYTFKEKNRHLSYGNFHSDIKIFILGPLDFQQIPANLMSGILRTDCCVFAQGP